MINPDYYRVSWLNSLALCPDRGVLSMLSDDTSGKAADNGTGIGRLAELCHRRFQALREEIGSNTATSEAYTDGQMHTTAAAAALTQCMAEQPTDFPLACMKDVAKVAGRYWEDPRAWSDYSPYGVVQPELCEAEVKLTLEPDEDDPTGQPIQLVGHLDQVRRDQNGHLSYWDIKATKRYEGASAAYAYAWQLAAYALAASETLGEPVHVGGIILVRAYLGKFKSKKPAADCGGVWIEAPWSHDQCRGMLRQVAYQIGRIRAGLIAATPGPTCTFCPGEGAHNCERALDDLMGGA